MDLGDGRRLEVHFGGGVGQGEEWCLLCRLTEGRVEDWKLHFCPKYHVPVKYPFSFALIGSSTFINENDNPLHLQNQVQLNTVFASFLPSAPTAGTVRRAESVSAFLSRATQGIRGRTRT